MIFNSFNLKDKEVKNRIVFPPIVCIKWSENGEVSSKHLNHYEGVAKGGVGLIITEAVCISTTGKLAPSQLGIWSNDFIKGFSYIKDRVHKEEVPILAQIHHGGIKSITETPVVPSKLENMLGSVKELSIEEIKEIEKQFINAGIRMKKAGLDGVEIHGAHGYLISYFLHPDTNKREDEYGGNIENRSRIVSNIVKGIRKECGEDFIIGIRYGGLNPTVDEGIKLGRIFENLGCDILHISYGIKTDEDVNIPLEFKEYNSCVYVASEIKKNVNIPVIASNEISTFDRAKKLIDDNVVDFVSIGRSILSDYDFVNKIREGEIPNKCFKCKPCRWPDCTSRNYYKNN